MNKEMFFPQIDRFSLALSHNEPIEDIEKDAALIVAEEETEILLGRRAYALSKGDALLALPFSYCRTRGKNCFQGYRISFPLDALHVFAPLTYLYTNGGTAFSFSPEERARLLTFCEALFTEQLAAIYVLPSIFSILEKNASPKSKNDLEIPLPKLLRRALAYIEEHAPSPIDTALLAERYGTSQSTIARLFRTHLETTPRKYAQALGRLYEQMRIY